MKKKDLRLERKLQREKENRASILDAAESIFAQKGYNLTTVDDVAERAQFSKATLYKYFKSKQDIFMKIILKSFEEALESIREIQSKDINSEGKLRELISYIASYHQKKRNIARIFFFEKTSFKKILDFDSEISNTKSFVHPNLPENFRAITLEINEIIRNIIKEGMEKGEFREIDDRDAVFVFGALLRGFYFRGPVSQKEYGLNESIDLLLSFYLYGIKKERKL
jgi:AcrR family transcriptional regulator